MKKFLMILAVLLIVSTAEARTLKKPLIEIAPRASVYLSEDNAFGIGSDVVFNPFRNIGFRLEAVELLFNDGTYFMLNHGTFKTLPKIDALIYIPMQQMSPYIHTGFGLVTGEGATLLALGGGMGFDLYMRRGTTLFIEPGLYILHFSNGMSDTDVLFRLSFGAKFGIF